MEDSAVVRVRHFSNNGNQKVVIAGNELRSCRSFGDVKNIVGEFLNIEGRSMPLFGIFKVHDYTVAWYLPKELCNDTDKLPVGNLELGFFRLSFDKELEWNLLKNDPAALMIMFSEVRYLHLYGTYISANPQAGHDKFLETLSLLKNESDKYRGSALQNQCFRDASLSRIKMIPGIELDILGHWEAKLNEFTECKQLWTKRCTTSSDTSIMECYIKEMETLRLYYWSYYYKCYCILCGESGPCLASCLDLNENFETFVTLSKTCLIFVGKTMSGEYIYLLEFPWCSIQSVSQDGGMFSFEVLIKNFNGQTLSFTLTLFSFQSDFLYSMSVHLLECQAKSIEDIISKNLSKPEMYSLIQAMLHTTLVKTEELASAILQHISEAPHSSSSNCSDTYDSYFVNKYFVPFTLDMAKISSRIRKTSPEHFYHGKQIIVIVFSLAEQYNSMKHYFTEEELKANQLLSSEQETHRSDEEKSREHKPEIRKIAIHNFWNKLIKVSLTTDFTVADVKHCIAQEVRLKRSSLKIFGLFICNADNPFDKSIKLLEDQQVLPSSPHFCFRRLSFIKKEETKICEQDSQALEFLWNEAKYMYEHNLVLLPEESRVKGKLFKARTLKHKLSVLTGLADFWWLSYYRVSSSPDLSTSSDTTAPSHIAITKDHLLLLDGRGLCLKKIPLVNVLSISANVSDSNTSQMVVIDVCNSYGTCEGVLESVSIYTVDHKLFLSLTRSVFDLHKSQQDAKHSYTSEQFVNVQFKGPSYFILETGTLRQRTFNQGFHGISKRSKLRHYSHQ